MKFEFLGKVPLRHKLAKCSLASFDKKLSHKLEIKNFISRKCEIFDKTCEIIFLKDVSVWKLHNPSKIYLLGNKNRNT